MNNELLGAHIAKYRKAAGITQEELGKAVGVSTQAVSRWECGGAPDVSLLPALADKLGVSIDSLFGRSQEQREDIYAHFYSWFDAIPQEKRLKSLSDFLSHVPIAMLCKGKEYDPREFALGLNTSSFTSDGDLFRYFNAQEDGFLMATRGRECPFFLLMPEPPHGFAANLFPLEEYRTLFTLLGKPGALDILAFLEQQRCAPFFTVHALSQRSGLSPEAAGPLLEELARLGLLESQSIETERGTEPIYRRDWSNGFVPFLFLARWLMDPSGSWYGVWTSRTRPVLTESVPRTREKTKK